MNDIGRKEQQLKESHVGGPKVGGNFPQRVIVKQFSDVLLDSGSRAVEQIDPPGADFEVGDQNVVDILFVFEEGQLPGLFWIFGNGTADHHKAVRFFPFVVNSPPELPDLPAMTHFLESDASGAGLDVGILLGYDHVATAAPVEKTNNPAAVKTRIQSESDAASANVLRDFLQADAEKRDGSGRRNSVSGSQRSVPEFLEMGLEAEQGMIRASSRFLGIVAHTGPLLFAVDHDHHRIYIEDERGPAGRQTKKINSQAVVQPNQLSDGFGRQTLQKATQGTLIGKGMEPQHLEKRSIVLEDLGLVDSPKSHDDRKDQSHHDFGWAVQTVPTQYTDVLLNQPAKPQLVAKTLDQPHSTEVSYVGFVEGNMDFSGSLWHMAQSSPLGAFLPWKRKRPYYTFSPSESECFSSLRVNTFTLF